MKKILMISTGGTIACKPGPDGLTPALTGEALVKLLPGLEGSCTVECGELFSIDSTNIHPNHWQKISRAVADNYTKYDGFVITHGTDTMAYTASALSSMLENVAKPVVITGSQLPAGAAGTDAEYNLLNSFGVAVSGVPGVHLVFGDRIISGRRASKMHTKEFDAFFSINAPCEAYICNGKIEWEALPDFTEGSFELRNGIEERVALIKLIPGIKPEIISWYIEKGYRGIVIESFGAGGIPDGEGSFMPLLSEALEKDIIVVCATQCQYDGVNLKAYPMGHHAEKLGVISAGTMTVERAVTKLMWALGNSESTEEAKKLFEEE